MIKDDDFVLLQHRDNKPGVYWPNHWCFPGGIVESSEDYKETAMRELEEETNYKAKDLSFLLSEEYKRTDGVPITRHVFWTIYDGKQKIECNEGQEMKFVSIKEFSGKKFIDGQERLFKLAIEQAQTSRKSIVV